MAKYYSLTESEYKIILDILKTKNTKEINNLKTSLEYQNRKLNEEIKPYILATKNHLSKNYPKLLDNEDILVDDDANVSVMDNGAYVHCWMWIDAQKNKKSKRQIK